MSATAPGIEPERTNPSSRLYQLLDNETFVAYLFILPAMIGFGLFYALPAVRGLFISFTDWDLLTDANFIGIQNYSELLRDREFWHSMRVTAYYVVLNIPIQTFLAVVIAVLMHRFVKGVGIRSMMLLPWLMPNVVVALLWLWILDPSLGVANEFLRMVGLPTQAFFGSVSQAMPTIAGVNIWRHVGYNALLVFAGLQTIPNDVYEAGSLDGASESRMFFSITLPLLRPVLVFVLVTSIVGSFQIFDTIAVTTSGGPVDATRVIYWYIFEYAFERFNFGYATAAAMVLFVVLIGVSLLQMRLLNASESDLA